MFNPQYKLTNKILNSLTEITEIKAFVERAKILPTTEIGLRRQAILRMTHSSTAIEGNQLNFSQVEALYTHKKLKAQERDIYEVNNYLRALKYIEKIVEEKQSLSEKIILKIHKLVTFKTLPRKESGYYRRGSVYVVQKRLGLPDLILYTAPPHTRVPSLVKNLAGWIDDNSTNKLNPIILAAIVHKEIAAIHPFMDGNGRTARALATLVLYSQGYDFRRLFALEDYYNENRQEYYRAINTGRKYNSKVDLTNWIEYFVAGFKQEIKQVKEKILALGGREIDLLTGEQIYLSQNQQKILEFIDLLGRISVKDAIGILSVSRRSAQLALQKLKKAGFIKQIGKGPASHYLLKR